MDIRNLKKEVLKSSSDEQEIFGEGAATVSFLQNKQLRGNYFAKHLMDGCPVNKKYPFCV